MPDGQGMVGPFTSHTLSILVTFEMIQKKQKKQRKTRVKIVHLFHRVHRIRKAHLLSLQIQEQQNICLIKNTSSKNSQQ